MRIMYRVPIVEIEPKNEPVKFDPERDSRRFFSVSVTNTSDRFLSFQVRVYPQGASGSEFHHWYSLKPRICAKKPPGTAAKFDVEIVESPIPGAEGEIPLVFEVCALEDKTCRVVLPGYKLEVLAGKYLTLHLFAPDSQLFVDPEQPVRLPVWVRNTRKKTTEVSLKLIPITLPEAWLEVGEVQLNVGADSTESVDFSIIVPKAIETEGKHRYEFEIVIVKPSLTQTVRETGALIVNPAGIVEFDCPSRSSVFPDDRSKQNHLSRDRPQTENENAIFYPLKLTNSSNIPQTLNLEITPTFDPNAMGSDREKIAFAVEPDCLTLTPGEERTVKATISNLHQPKWFDRTLTFEVSVDPPKLPKVRVTPRHTHVLNLKLRSIGWLKWAVGFFILLALAALPLSRYFFTKRHAATINTVNFIDSGQRVVSGSSDRHLFNWEVNRPLENLYRGWNGVYFTRDLPNFGPVVPERPARSSEDLLVAAGLTNGEILIWDAVNEDEAMRPLNQTTSNTAFDNIFDLRFSSDARYLFSSHGSGFVRLWDLGYLNDTTSTLQAKRQIYMGMKPAYSIVETDGHKPDTRWLIVGGEFNKLWVWSWAEERHRVFDLSSIFKTSEPGKELDFTPIYGKTDYIASLAADDRALVTTDTQGFVRIWDLTAMRECLRDADRSKSIRKENPWEYVSDFNYFYRTWSCQSPLIRWESREEHLGRPVRSVALARYKQCYYLASTGDDGRVILWSFNEALLQPGNARKPTVRELDRIPDTALNSVDIVVDRDRRLIRVVADVDRGRIKLYRHRIASDANCK